MFFFLNSRRPLGAIIKILNLRKQDTFLTLLKIFNKKFLLNTVEHTAFLLLQHTNSREVECSFI